MPSSEKLMDDRTTLLFKAMMSLRTVDECYKFFEDLCTVAEIKSLAERFQVALMLDEGRTYTEIAEKTGASTATISRVKRFLQYGADGYRLIIDRMREEGILPPKSSPPKSGS
ncbi:MAG TPA: helix-turn-helix domain-containing protein [Firmicutes bacterium]|nr:helix-turn-helix domain-containing protein [Bacillota bacterium]HHY98247.1 helix-turn-helix domain-containing protein [Bacillota bacterium]